MDLAEHVRNRPASQYVLSAQANSETTVFACDLNRGDRVDSEGDEMGSRLDEILGNLGCGDKNVSELGELLTASVDVDLLHDRLGFTLGGNGGRGSGNFGDILHTTVISIVDKIEEDLLVSFQGNLESRLVHHFGATRTLRDKSGGSLMDLDIERILHKQHPLVTCKNISKRIRM